MKTKYLLLTLTLLLVAGCSTLPGKRNPADPWEAYNRKAFEFNDALDTKLLKPVANTYTKVLPQVVRTGVSNFFSNLGDVVVLANDVLQFKFKQAGSDTMRLLTNTTMGALGLVDVGTPMGFPKHNEDFGQTLGYWGAGPGPYFVIPFLGPSSVRDAFGRVADSPLSIYNHIHDTGKYVGTLAVDTTQTRAGLLGATNVLEQAALDRYVFVRDAYLQRRRSLVYDGKPPKTKEELEEEQEMEEPDPARPAAKAPADEPKTPADAQ